MPREGELGITEYLNKDNPGCQAVLKQRFSDFNVYEVELGGNLVRLGGQDIPGSPTVDKTGGEMRYSQLGEEDRALLTETEFAMVKLVDKDPATHNSFTIDVTSMDKESRKRIHQVVKRFPNLDSNTVDAEDRKTIVARQKVVKKGGGRKDWPRDRPRFLHFSLFKENTETFDAISLLAGKCRTDAKYFGFAGTKDRRGRTTQRCSVSMVSAEQLLGAAKTVRNVEVGSFSYQPAELKLGQLGGNRFELCLRAITAGQAELRPVMEHFTEHGFINYFGTQRFGTTAVATHTVGKLLLSSQWSQAVDTILQGRAEGDNDVMREARRVWQQERDPKKALEVLRRGRKDRTVEGQLLAGLAKCHSNDSVGALESLARHQRQLYCHAFQSLLWNKVVSRRLQQHGMAVLKGDLVYTDTPTSVPSVEGTQEASKEDQVEFVEDPEKYSIHDVLIPIPGCKVKFPENETKVWFEEYLKEEGLTMEVFDNSVKTYKMPGDYRNILVKPKDVSWNIACYNTETEDLIDSEVERLNKSRSNQSEGNLRALLVYFTLPSSCYATMAIREILRIETDKNSLMQNNLIAGKRKAEEIENDQVPEKQKC